MWHEAEEILDDIRTKVEEDPDNNEAVLCALVAVYNRVMEERRRAEDLLKLHEKWSKRRISGFHELSGPVRDEITSSQRPSGLRLSFFCPPIETFAIGLHVPFPGARSHGSFDGLGEGSATRVQPVSKNSSCSSFDLPERSAESSGKPPQALPRSKRSRASARKPSSWLMRSANERP